MDKKKKKKNGKNVKINVRKVCCSEMEKREAFKLLSKICCEQTFLPYLEVMCSKT